MTSGKSRKQILKVIVLAVALLSVMVFALSFSVQSQGVLNASNTLTVSPSACQNQTVYKYQWMNDTSSGAPPQLSNSSISYFSPTTEDVMFGGMNKTSYTNETWIYESQKWTKLTTQSSIPALTGVSMNYYPRGDDIVLFGGQNLSSSGNITYSKATWIFTGLTWTPLKGLVIAPTPRAFSASAYSTSTSSIYLFGGITSSGYSNTTWSFKDNSWIKLNTTGKIPAMEGSTMEALPDGNILLYGGFNGTYSASTWMLNVTTNKWHLLPETVSPGKLAFSHIKYFSTNNFLLLYGGVSSKGNPSNSSWMFSPSTMVWSQLSIPTPAAEYGQAMSILTANNTIVLFGGTYKGTYTNTTNQFQNNTYNWLKFTETGLPSNSKWGMQLGNGFVNTTSNYVEFLLMAGTYNYTATGPSGYTHSSGNVSMYASFLTSSISFSKIPGIFYYTYGIIAGIVIILVAYVGSLIYRKILK
jgi:hypothetical protein